MSAEVIRESEAATATDAATETAPLQTPALSIVTCTRNSMRFLEDTFRSVEALGVDYEWIVFDSSSTDGTVAYVEGLATERSWIALKHNDTNEQDLWTKFYIALQHARGRYVVFLDHDDTFPSSEALAESIAALDAQPSCHAALMQVAYMTEQGRIYKTKRVPFARYPSTMSRRRMFWTLFLAPTLPYKFGAFVIRRSLFEKLGARFDIDFALAATQLTDFALIPRVGLNYRNVAGSYSAAQRVHRFDDFWVRFANEYLPNERYYGLKYLISAYKVAMCFGKIVYTFFTPNRI